MRRVLKGHKRPPVASRATKAASFAAILNPAVAGAVVAFPGAVGYGKDSLGGRGGTIIHVTNRNATGTGSLKAALDASGPRTVVFDVGGTFDLSSLNDYLYINNPFVTIAGQTAPAPGVNIKGTGIFIQTHNVVIRHVNIRTAGTSNAFGGDTISIRRFTGGTTTDIIVDHCGLWWGLDENLDISSSNHPIGPERVTIQSCIISGNQGSGGVLISGAQNFTFYQNVLPFNGDRNPASYPYAVAPATYGELINNFSWANLYDIIVGTNVSSTTCPYLYSVINNYYPMSDSVNAGQPAAMQTQTGTYLNGSQIYISGNLTTRSREFFHNYNAYNPLVGSPPLSSGAISALTAGESMASTLTGNCGSRPLNRDAQVQQVITMLTNRQETYVDNIATFGGHPTLASTSQVYTPPGNPNGIGSSGYTRLEEDLAALSAALIP